MTNAPDCCVIAAIRIVNGSYVITAQGGEHAVLDADSGMTLNDLSSPLSLLETRRSGRPREMVAPGPSADELAGR